jgi:hypothetical protein
MIIIAFSMVSLLLLYLIPAVSVTRRLLASDFFDPWQKRMQLLIIWCIPIIGAALVASMLLPHIEIKRGHLPLLELLVLSAFVSSSSHSAGFGQPHDGNTGDVDGTDGDL